MDNIKVALVGDLANGRTVRSLAYMLAANYNNVSFAFVAPTVVKMGDDIKEYLDKQGCKWEEVYDLKEVRSDRMCEFSINIKEVRDDTEFCGRCPSPSWPPPSSRWGTTSRSISTSRVVSGRRCTISKR